ncbi:MAG: Spy/CpxP family protein refolding chaperone [Myxococcales bacterium]|nr:Spy/CpxP family protein refolding chaperone [Myxococcales bacterium]
MNEDRNQDTQPTGAKRRRRFLIVGGVGLAALASMLTARVWAHGHRGHFGHRGMHASSAAELREHLGDRTDHALDHLKATDAQRARIDAILDRVSPRLFELHTRGRTLHDQAHHAFEGGDRRALELARSRGVALIDEMSREGLAALNEINEVLSDEQRAELQMWMKRHRH